VSGWVARTSSAMQQKRAAGFAEGLRAVVEPLRRLPSRAIAAALNERGIKTPTGGEWQSVTVLRLINRLEIANSRKIA
jgi:Recombinase